MIHKLLKKHRWLQTPVGLFMLLISPILLPIVLCIEYWDDVETFYSDCFDAIRMKTFKKD